MNLKIPPHDLEAEQAIIGAMLGNAACVPKIKGIVEPEDFYREAHRHIVRAIYGLQEPDLLTVKSELERTGQLEASGGLSYLMEMAGAIAVTAGIEHHAGHIKSLADRRGIFQTCQSILTSGEPNETLLAGLKERIRMVEQGRIGVPYQSNQELVAAVYSDIERRRHLGGSLVGLSVGFSHIDEACQGLEPATTTYLIARPSMGKTALGLQMAEHVARQGATLVFSLESSAVALTRRRMASKSSVYLSRIRSGNIENNQWQYLQNAANESVGHDPILIDHPRFKTVENLVALCESIALERPIKFVMVDHLQRMKSQKPKQSRHLEISHISEELSSLAKTLNCPLLILCQLNREIEKQGGKGAYPQLHHIKESGDVEANADSVWGLWRKDRESEMARLECLKGRDTGTWVKWLKFDRYIQRFYQAEDQEKTTQPAPETQNGYDV